MILILLYFYEYKIICVYYKIRKEKIQRIRNKINCNCTALQSLYLSILLYPFLFFFSINNNYNNREYTDSKILCLGKFHILAGTLFRIHGSMTFLVTNSLSFLLTKMFCLHNWKIYLLDIEFWIKFFFHHF